MALGRPFRAFVFCLPDVPGRWPGLRSFAPLGLLPATGLNSSTEVVLASPFCRVGAALISIKFARCTAPLGTHRFIFIPRPIGRATALFAPKGHPNVAQANGLGTKPPNPPKIQRTTPNQARKGRPNRSLNQSGVPAM